MSRPRLLFCYPARKQTFRENYVRLVMAVHLWLRAETKPNERRTHITPERCKDLVQAGKKNLRALTLFKIVYNIPSPASAFYSYWTFHIFQQHPYKKMAGIRTFSNSRRPLRNEIRRVNLVRFQYSPVH